MSRKSLAAARPLRKSGIITIVDALGSATRSESQIVSFLQVRDEIIERYRKVGEEMKEKFDLPMPVSYTFGDTLLFVMEVLEPAKVDLYIRAVSICARRLIVYGMEKGVLFRGAIGLGDYYEDSQSNTVLGPAVADAAAWYDKSEWIGVMYTPKLSMKVREICSWAHEGVVAYWKFALRYTVPTKAGPREVYAVNWPYLHNLTKEKPPATAASRLYALLSEHSVPLGSEEKYSNTIRFYVHATEENAKQTS